MYNERYEVVFIPKSGNKVIIAKDMEIQTALTLVGALMNKHLLDDVCYGLRKLNIGEINER